MKAQTSSTVMIPAAAKPNPDEAPIFVVGVPRSGTTLLRAMLNAHRRIYLTHEASFYLKSFFQKRVAGAPWLESYIHSYAFSWLRLSSREIREQFREPIPRERLPDVYRAIMRTKAGQHAKPRYGDKTPMHVSCLARIFEDFPDARIIHIVRDPRATIASLMRMPWSSGSYLLCNEFYKGLLRNAQPFEDRIHQLRLEDLIERPRTEMETLLDFVDEEWDEAVLQHPTAAPANDLPPFPWHEHASRGIRLAEAATSGELPDAWVRYVEFQNQLASRKYGYEPLPLAREPSLIQIVMAVLEDVPGAARALWRASQCFRKLARPHPPEPKEAQRLIFGLNPNAWRHYPHCEIPDPPSLDG